MQKYLFEELMLPSQIIDTEEIYYEPIHRSHSTFIDGLNKSIHNWFRLTPSFGPELVKYVLDEFDYNNNSIVLDPFSGASTTLIECQLIGIKSYGFEINPFLFFVGKTSLEWDLNPLELNNLAANIYSCFMELKKQYIGYNCENLPFQLPQIHNVYRWWRKDVLFDLVILKETINKTTLTIDIKYKDFLLLCLAGVLIPDLTNVTLGKLQLHFIDRSSDKIDVINSFNNHVDKMIIDIMKTKEIKIKKYSTLFLTDSTELKDIKINEKIDFVITSPPYPNRYSYVWNTRPYLYLFDFYKSAKEASSLDLKTIGGTWGTATSVLNKGVMNPIDNVIGNIITPITDRIRKNDNLMANYVMKYFNLLYKQILKMDSILSASAKLAYVVGNSEIKGIFVETDVLLSKLFKVMGFNKTKIQRFRKRNSGKNLFESIVFAWK